MRVLVDTNILLRLRDADDPHHLSCVQALRRLQGGGNEPCICAQAIIEYWVVATRPRDVNGLGLRPAEAETDLRDFDHAFVLLPEPADIGVRWRALVTHYAVSGRRAHDTRLVALMLAHGVTHLLTLNATDFARYNEITCLTPENVPEPPPPPEDTLEPGPPPEARS